MTRMCPSMRGNAKNKYAIVIGWQGSGWSKCNSDVMASFLGVFWDGELFVLFLSFLFVFYFTRLFSPLSLSIVTNAQEVVQSSKVQSPNHTLV